MDNLKYIIESLLFVSSTPLSMERLRQAVPEADSKMVREALDALSREYEARGGGFALTHVAGGYQLRTRPEFAQWIKRLHQTQPVRLSKPALETLAIIAYRQPVLRSDVEYIRGVDCGGVLKMLLEKQLIRVLGRDTEKAGRPIIYSTTKRFLEIFDLKDLSELPTLKELEEMGLSKKQGQEGDMDPDDLVPALADGAGFAEFSNLRNYAPLDSPGPGKLEALHFPSDYENEEGEEEVYPKEFAVDGDRFPEDITMGEESGDVIPDGDVEESQWKSDSPGEDSEEDWKNREEAGEDWENPDGGDDLPDDKEDFPGEGMAFPDEGDDDGDYEEDYPNQEEDLDEDFSSGDEEEWD
ncbi:MAG: SMC-Scp complex subunit ScpB [Desulfatibacillum sp.]|nr:SMC-Scp complex subunit ScpB [Desulfatibacillum sp.]